MRVFSKSLAVANPIIVGIGIAMCLSLAAHAAPASPFPIAFTQPDGTIIQIYNKGDEFLSWTEDAQGNLIAFDQSVKAYCYAHWTDNAPFSTGEIVGLSAPGTNGKARAMGNNIPQSLLNKAHHRHEARNALMTQGRKKMVEKMKSSGWPPAPNPSPQLAPLSDLKRTVLVIHATWEDRTGIGTPKLDGNHIYSYVFDPAARSVNNYYKELFRSSEDIIVPATVDNPLDGRQGIIEVTFPGRFPGESMETLNMPIVAASAKGLINFSDYDTNDDGILDSTELSVAIIFDTREFLGGAWWPELDKSLTGNAKIPMVCGQGAFYGNAGNIESDMMAVGMFCHEFGHSSYFFYDTYDYTYQSQGHGWWSLMAAGMWAYQDNEKSGDSPAYLDASNLVGATRLGNMGEFGLLMPGVISASQNNLTASSHLDVYRVNSPVSEKQYFLLQQRKWGLSDNYDRGAFFQLAPEFPPFQRGPKPGAGGLIIYHEDENVPGYYWLNNKRTHYRTGIEEAHGVVQHLQMNTGSGDLGDLWGNSKKSFSYASNPTSALYSTFTNDAIPPSQIIDSGIEISNIAWDSTAQATSFDVGIATPTITVTITDLPVALFTGEAWTFQASVTGIGGGVAWTASAGDINPANGKYIAPSAAQTATITATSVSAPSFAASEQIYIAPASMTNFDGNSPTDPSLLGFANAFGSTSPSDLAKYDLTGDGKIDDEDIEMLFRAMGWQWTMDN